MSERRNRPLTAKFVGAVKATGKHHDGLGQGLYLRVDPGGGKFWVQRIMVRGRRREIGLGSFPTVGLADARDLAVQNKRLAREGDDPVALKRTAKLGALSFRAATRAAHEELAPSIKNPKDRAAFLSSLERHVFPRLSAGRSALVFPSRSEKPLSDMTLSKLIKSLGYDADVHGFRTSFRTWTQEQTDYPRELCEVALSHKVGDQVERAYARSDLFEKRRVMMEEWAEFLTRCS